MGHFRSFMARMRAKVLPQPIVHFRSFKPKTGSLSRTIPPGCIRIHRRGAGAPGKGGTSHLYLAYALHNGHPGRCLYFCLPAAFRLPVAVPPRIQYRATGVETLGLGTRARGGPPKYMIHLFF